MRWLIVIAIVFLYTPTYFAQDRICSLHDASFASLSPRFSQVDFYGITLNGAIMTRYWFDGWSDSFRVTPDGVAVESSPLEALVPRGDQVDLYWISPNGEIRITSWIGGWGDVYTLTAPNVVALNSSLEALVPRGDQVDLYWVSPEGAVKSMFYNGQWSEVFSLTNDGVVRDSSPLKAIVPRGDQVDLYWVSPSGAIMSMYYNAGWSQPFSITQDEIAHIDTNLEAFGSSTGAGVYWVSPNEELMASRWNAGASSWTSPEFVSKDVDPGTSLSAVGSLDNPDIPSPMLLWTGSSNFLVWGTIDSRLKVTPINRGANENSIPEGLDRLSEYSGQGAEWCSGGYASNTVSWFSSRPNSKALYIAFFDGFDDLQFLQIAAITYFD